MNGWYMQYFIIYISPAGTTRHVAKVIDGKLSALGRSCKRVDLGTTAGRAQVKHTLAAASCDSCLFIGTPVYASHAVPAIMDFIERLPLGSGCCSVPFVTWGAVTSGVALFEMAEALGEKGYPALAAAKVVAEHSLLWQSADPLGKGRPDADDDALVQDMVRKIVAGLDAGAPRMLTAEVLKYQPEPLRKIMAGLSVGTARKMLPQISVRRDRCTLCGACSAACTAGAVEVSDGPVFNESCIACYSCLRACTEGALQADFSKLGGGLAQRAKDYGEACDTVIFRP